MTKRIASISEVEKLQFVNEDEKVVFLNTATLYKELALKEPIIKIFETKNVKQARLYLYDRTSWKYLLNLTCDLVK